MDILDIIAKKRDKGTLSRDEIHFFIKKVNSRGKRQNRVLVFSNKVSNFYYYYHCS